MMEDSDGIPDGWGLVNVGEVIEKISATGKKLKQTEYQDAGKLPVIDQGQLFIGGYTDKENFKVCCNLPVIVFGDHTKIFKYINFDFVAGADGVKVIKPIAVFDPKLFFYFLQVLPLPERGYARHFQYLEKSFISLPPLNEQQRIISRLEQLLAQVNAAKEHLAKVPLLIKQLRQSVLAAASSGRLTEEWRREHPDVEPASELLKRIQDERINKAKSEGRRKLKKSENLESTEINKEGLAELPDSWVWCRMELLIDSMKNGLYKPMEYYGSGVTCLRMYNIEDGHIIWKDLKKMRLTKKEIEEYKLLPNDLLVNRVNSRELVGKTAIIPPNIGDVVYESKNIRLRLITSSASPRYINYLLMTRIIRDQIELEAKQTVGMATISQSQIEDWIIPLAPVLEQHAVAENIDRLFHFADEVEHRYQQAQAHVDKLTQSILAKAFRGELVPQDPNDEPASVLFERIKQERAKNEKKVKKARKRTAKTLLDY